MTDGRNARFSFYALAGAVEAPEAFKVPVTAGVLRRGDSRLDGPRWVAHAQLFGDGATVEEAIAAIGTKAAALAAVAPQVVQCPAHPGKPLGHGPA